MYKRNKVSRSKKFKKHFARVKAFNVCKKVYLENKTSIIIGLDICQGKENVVRLQDNLSRSQKVNQGIPNKFLSLSFKSLRL